MGRVRSLLTLNDGAGPISTPPNLRERKKLATRQSLQDAALRLFAANGFGATSVDEIAAAADVSRSTFFRYFGSKDAVLFAEMEEAGELFMELLLARPAHEQPIIAFEEALVELAERIDGDARRNSSRLIEHVLKNDDGEVRTRHLSEMIGWTQAVAGWLARREGHSEPTVEDRLAATVCMAAVQEIGDAWREAGDELPAVEAIRAGFSALRTIVGGRPY